MGSSCRKLIVGRNSHINFSEEQYSWFVTELVHQLSGTEKKMFLSETEQ